MIHHGLLDWRLALSLLLPRILGAPVRIDGDFSYPELAEWPEMAGRLRESFCRSFGAEPREFAPLPGPRVGGHDVIVIHPPGIRESRGGVSPKPSQSPKTNPVPRHFHNLLRPESWAYQSLGQQNAL